MSAIEALQFWRNEDHEDNIVLSRHEICTLLDEVARLRASLEEVIGALRVGDDWQIWKADQIEAALAKEGK
jgi:hypothetical protein